MFLCIRARECERESLQAHVFLTVVCADISCSVEERERGETVFTSLFLTALLYCNWDTHTHIFLCESYIHFPYTLRKKPLHLMYILLTI